mmetsp:Transcript_49136/g.120481  ORF Transcript_49136/g.120481 Transcript_49136/m.120481 type:complete len:86 (+) Transcript_49136:1007-1264(+)
MVSRGTYSWRRRRQLSMSVIQSERRDRFGARRRVGEPTRPTQRPKEASGAPGRLGPSCQRSWPAGGERRECGRRQIKGRPLDDPG